MISSRYVKEWGITQFWSVKWCLGMESIKHQTLFKRIHNFFDMTYITLKILKSLDRVELKLQSHNSISLNHVGSHVFWARSIHKDKSYIGSTHVLDGV